MRLCVCEHVLSVASSALKKQTVGHVIVEKKQKLLHMRQVEKEPVCGIYELCMK